MLCVCLRKMNVTCRGHGSVSKVWVSSPVMRLMMRIVVGPASQKKSSGKASLRTELEALWLPSVVVVEIAFVHT